MPSSRVSILCWTFVLVLLRSAAFAQGSTATLSGSVRDEQTLVVPGATVAIAGTENHFSRKVVTGSDGGFEMAGLLPGSIRLSIESSGFTREEVQVRLEVNQRVRSMSCSSAAALTQQVEVSRRCRCFT